ncbi:hypothetical protein RchiOBHm_Chr7g0193321 [Rosa chinensis]|uniref:Uncharacterized protein n=1 Tax=Rosa chinensis TaxID=74649 RepID=A0A2P6P5U4_ROSCH|nr:hypothetical protein RchiOBHm_Chr7g0193321 [Rosa chinensis]
MVEVTQKGIVNFGKMDFVILYVLFPNGLSSFKLPEVVPSQKKKKKMLPEVVVENNANQSPEQFVVVEHDFSLDGILHYLTSD